MKNTSCVSVALYYSTKIKFINIVDLHYFRYIHTQKKINFENFENFTFYKN